MSLREAAKRAGLSAPYFLDVERGKRQPSPAALKRLAAVLEIPFERLTENRQTAGTGASVAASEPILSSETLIYLASGVVNLYEKNLEKTDRETRSNAREIVPYPEKLQQSFDLLTCAFLARRKEPPQSIVELLRLCAKPFHEWHLETLPEGVSPNDALLTNNAPSQLCEDYARQESDLAAALAEEKFVREMRRECADKPAVYTALRRKLIEKPILTENELRDLRLSNPLSSVRHLLDAAYEDAPQFLAEGDCFYLCPTCGDFVVAVRNKRTIERRRCREETCEQESLYSTKNLVRLSVEERVKQLKRGLRRYVAAPGKAELRLEKTLKKIGAKANLRVELYPLLDAYDLRVCFADGEAWAIDVKDWANPYLLAKSLAGKEKPFRFAATWQRAFFVFPEHRRRQNRCYVEIFEQHFPLPPSSRTAAAFEKDFVALVKERLNS